MKNVLIVEDSKAIRSMLRVALEEMGDFFRHRGRQRLRGPKTLPRAPSTSSSPTSTCPTSTAWNSSVSSSPTLHTGISPSSL